MKLFRFLLFPVSMVYGMLVAFRNGMYNIGIIRAASYDIPIISMGNIAVGGTGKSPHIEYLIRLLQPSFQIATLSRGYGRLTQGYRVADNKTTVYQVGDEPLQFKQKFEKLIVAVDGNRRRGIKKLSKEYDYLKAILLDDAFQHRAVKPGLNIILTDYSNLYVNDHLMPAGSLREWRSASKRADVIIVSKCPDVLSPLERRIIKEGLRIKPYQNIYFSYLKYGDFIPLSKPKTKQFLGKEYYFKEGFSIVLITGIAKPSSLVYHVKPKAIELIHLRFSDHHKYTSVDVRKIRRVFDRISADKKILLTTEKDLMRLKTPELQDSLKDLPLFYIPIEVAFHGNDGELFNHQVTDYVSRN